jgi:hypothetical protein
MPSRVLLHHSAAGILLEREHRRGEMHFDILSRSTAANRKSVTVLSSFHECERCALCPKANSPI